MKTFHNVLIISWHCLDTGYILVLPFLCSKDHILFSKM